MGISRVHGGLQLLQDVIRQERIVLSGLRMAELGNQYFREDVLGCEVSAKLVFGAMGVDHVSFDLNGRDGAVALDLGKPLDPQHVCRGQVVTNFGTSEHIEDSQYWCWRSIHELCTGDGLMLHAIPEVGSWPRHGKWHYTSARVSLFAEAAGYDSLILRGHPYTHPDGRKQHSILCCFRKGVGLFPEPAIFQKIMFPPGQPCL